MNSNYIAFEGIDGSGKTSLIENLSTMEVESFGKRSKEFVLANFSWKKTVDKFISEV